MTSVESGGIEFKAVRHPTLNCNGCGDTFGSRATANVTEAYEKHPYLTITTLTAQAPGIGDSLKCRGTWLAVLVISH